MLLFWNSQENPGGREEMLLTKGTRFDMIKSCEAVGTISQALAVLSKDRRYPNAPRTRQGLEIFFYPTKACQSTVPDQRAEGHAEPRGNAPPGEPGHSESLTMPLNNADGARLKSESTSQPRRATDLSAEDREL